MAAELALAISDSDDGVAGAGAGAADGAGSAPIGRGVDVASASNFMQWRALHYAWDAAVDFATQTLRGSVTIMFDKLDEGCNEIVLDAHHLDVTAVKAVGGDSDGADLPFRTDTFTDFGGKLIIDATASQARRTGREVDGEKQTIMAHRIKIDYTVGPKGSAITWLTPEQTAGKEHPYLYSIGQAVMNRALLPCQDTPQTRITYTACVQCPKPLTVLLAAHPESTIDGSTLVGEAVEGDDSVHKFRFKMAHSIPVYLLAMAVGELSCATIGPRSRVWAEPSVVEAAQAEFDGITERYLARGEELFGEYKWGKYDLLCMPPSFAYGGMENPCLTFVTPCLLAGDKSLGDVVCHEICHSWFGNLVTNGSWSEFFLNEGFTMFAQRRILEKEHGEAFTALETLTGKALLWQAWEADKDSSPYLSKLRMPLEPGIDPDDTYAEYPYEKGFAFICYLRDLAGCSKDEFDAKFLRTYVQKHASKCVFSEQMINHYFTSFPDVAARREELTPALNAWLNDEGLPSFWPDCSAADELTKPAEALVEAWVSGAGAGPEGETGGVEDSQWGAWGTYPRLHFLDTLLAKDASALRSGDAAGVLAALDAAYDLSGSRNAEIQLRWAQIVAKHSFEPGFAAVGAFLASQGKQKYVVPIYRALVDGGEVTKKFGVETFTGTRTIMQNNIQGRIEGILGLKAE